MDDPARLRRKDTSKGPPLRVLSLDGGGVRGYSMFIILQELMHRTFVEINGRAPKRHEIPKPCDHFDLIGGTGTGGLVAIMLGRLRLDIDTCKDVYVRMTRRVFQTDKTIAGIPYKSTLFKASKLEEAIRECVREHTIFEDEGNDVLSSAVPMTPDMVSSPRASVSNIPQRSMSQGSRYSQVGRSPTGSRASLSMGSVSMGNSNALLYDIRENRTKTAVTTVFKGARGSESTVLLRSYDSRKEPSPDFNCTIWQAGRATSATGLAFKPIQIGQSVYHDDGTGKFNPAPLMLDEAVQNEWPGRDIGVFVSIGTGKIPNETSHNEHDWLTDFLGGTIGAFAEAKKQLFVKIAGCEDTHQFMLRQHLANRGVSTENYFRFNVEVGVGEFGMNEWARLSDISTNTRMYLSSDEIQRKNIDAAAKLAKVHFAEIRRNRAEARQNLGEGPQQQAGAHFTNESYYQQESANAVELPGDQPDASTTNPFQHGVYEHRPSIADQKYTVTPDETMSSSAIHSQHQTPASTTSNGWRDAQAQHFYQHHQYQDMTPTRPSYEDSTISRTSYDAPPLPPKRPLPYPDGAGTPTSAISPLSTQQRFQENRHSLNMGDMGRMLPYPDTGAPPPAVNTANKPQIRP